MTTAGRSASSVRSSEVSSRAVSDDAEHREHLVEHLAMLRRRHDADARPRRRSHGEHDRRELDGFGPGAGDDQHGDAIGLHGGMPLYEPMTFAPAV
jgi:hypothetical protein